MKSKENINARNERQDAAENRQRILEAAQKLFDQSGVEQVSMNQIAIEAGAIDNRSMAIMQTPVYNKMYEIVVKLLSEMTAISFTGTSTHVESEVLTTNFDQSEK